METSKLKKFVQYARRSLIDQVSSKLVLVLAEDSAARRESTSAVRKLEEQISEHGKEQVIEISPTSGSTAFVHCVSWM
jgi:hypothetical protein